MALPPDLTRFDSLLDLVADAIARELLEEDAARDSAQPEQSVAVEEPRRPSS